MHVWDLRASTQRDCAPSQTFPVHMDARSRSHTTLRILHATWCPPRSGASTALNPGTSSRFITLTTTRQFGVHDVDVVRAKKRSPSGRRKKKRKRVE